MYNNYAKNNFKTFYSVRSFGREVKVIPQLRDLATITTGLTLRQKPEPVIASDVRLLQLGDVGVDGVILLDNLIPVKPDSSIERYVAEEGDLVFRGRGAGISVAVVPAHHDQMVVVAPLILLRPNRELVHPEYLSWAIMSPDAQRHFALHIRGTSVMGVGKKDLETLEIWLPPMRKQHQIAEIVSLQRTEEQLLNRYLVTRRKLVNAMIQEAVSISDSKM